MPGHTGTIYAASNAVLTGRATPRTITVLPDGRTLSARTAAGAYCVLVLIIPAMLSPRAAYALLALTACLAAS